MNNGRGRQESVVTETQTVEAARPAGANEFRVFLERIGDGQSQFARTLKRIGDDRTPAAIQHRLAGVSCPRK
jgi:hypothetical protein